MVLWSLTMGCSEEAAAQALQTVGQRGRHEALEPTAGDWQTWLAPSVTGLLPPPPPHNAVRRRAEIRELLAIQARRTEEIRQTVRFWDPQGGIPAWSQILLDTIKETKTDPVRASRALALFHTALADATVAVWFAKYRYRRPQPARVDRRVRSRSAVHPHLPSYPSEHAAVAAAASTVLNYLFPAQTIGVHGVRMTFDEAANEAAQSRLWAGANYRSDLEPGFRMGQAVGWMAAQRGQTDGSSAVWDLTSQPGRPSGPASWVPTPPANAFPPLHPLAGSWNPWLLQSGAQFQPAAPPALQEPFPSPAFLQEVAEVKQVADNRTVEQQIIADFWADSPGASFTPPGHWAQVGAEQVEKARLSTPRAARAMALLSVGLADSAIACWNCKFAFWVMRPVTAIRTLSGQPFYDPEFLSYIPTPPFPSYTSGHSTFSGCASTVLEHLFPGGVTTDAFGQIASFRDAADQAAVSRLYGGIHFRSDNEEGLACGRSIAEVVIERARSDGAYVQSPRFPA
jgi:membrane-associated phospholipid phosphatase